MYHYFTLGDFVSSGGFRGRKASLMATAHRSRGAVTLASVALVAFVLAHFAPGSGVAYGSNSVICGATTLLPSGTLCCLAECSMAQARLHRILQTARKALRVSLRTHDFMGRNVNCFGTAAFVSHGEFELPQYLEPFEIDRLVGTMRRVAAPAAQPGDLVLLRQNGRGFVIDPETRQPFYMDMRLPVHAAVYLGSGMIFQKESALSDVFSFSSIEQALRAYLQLGGEYRFRGVIEAEFYRAR
jgi:hypothetical protein